MSVPTWTSTGLIHYPLIDRVALAPDGQSVAYAVRYPHMTDDASEFRYAVWLASVDGQTPPVRLTQGESAAQPQWSPDGAQIAFLRKTPANGKTGIWLMPAARRRSAAPHRQRRLSATSRSSNGVPTAGRSPFSPHRGAKRRACARAAARIPSTIASTSSSPNSILWMSAGAGEPASPARRVTSGRRHVIGLDWSPDGARLAYTHRANTLFDSWHTMRLATVAAAPDSGAAESELPLDLGAVANRDGIPAYSPDGRWIACEVGVENTPWAYACHIHLFPVEGGPARRLAQVSDEQPTLIGWDTQSRGVYVVNQAGINTQIAFLPADGADASVVVAREALISARDLNAHNQLALVMENFDAAQAVYVADLDGAKTAPVPRRVAQPSAPDYPAGGPLPQTKLLRWTTPDGFEIEGILYLPAGYDEASGRQAAPAAARPRRAEQPSSSASSPPRPTITRPPRCANAASPCCAATRAAAAAMARTSASPTARTGAAATIRDLQQGVDTVIELGIADPERLGICGWSYGGFMTSWTITQTAPLQGRVHRRGGDQR